MFFVLLHTFNSEQPVHIHIFPFGRNIRSRLYQLFYFCKMATLWYKKKWVVVLLHIAVWALIYLLPLMLMHSFRDNERPHAEADRSLFIYLTLFTDVILIILFYLNALVLIPKFIYRRKLTYY